jgi:hypothetical protein
VQWQEIGSPPLDRHRKPFLGEDLESVIFSQDRGSRLTAECDDPNRVIVGFSLRELLDRLEQIVGGADQ